MSNEGMLHKLIVEIVDSTSQANTGQSAPPTQQAQQQQASGAPSTGTGTGPGSGSATTGVSSTTVTAPSVPSVGPPTTQQPHHSHQICQPQNASVSTLSLSFSNLYLPGKWMSTYLFTFWVFCTAFIFISKIFKSALLYPGHCSIF